MSTSPEHSMKQLERLAREVASVLSTVPVVADQRLTARDAFDTLVDRSIHKEDSAGERGPYLELVSLAGRLHKALPLEENSTLWQSVENSIGDVIVDTMNLAEAHGHSVEECYAAMDGPGHVPASIPS